MAVIEIQTIEGGRLEWVAIAADTNQERLIDWGHRLLAGFHRNDLKPSIRILDKEAHRGGVVIGAWQDDAPTPRMVPTPHG